jgi:hypothetical protein
MRTVSLSGSLLMIRIMLAGLYSLLSSTFCNFAEVKERQRLPSGT